MTESVSNKVVLKVGGGPPRSFKIAVAAASFALAIIFPIVVQSPYLKHIGILTFSYITLALSYDLVVGRVGALSLAQVAFFGTGAYASSLIGIHLGWSAIPRLLVTVLVALFLGMIIGIPSFRLSYHSFAMGTLGFAYIMLLIITNWVEVTRGPLCLYAIPRLNFAIWPGVQWVPMTVNQYYFLELSLVVMSVLLVSRLAGSRIGRTMLSLRQDSILASSLGVNALKYQMFAFLASAAIASVAGAIYASYTTVTCPSEFAFYYTVNLLVILFLGGRASIPGIILAAIIFTAAPEILRVANEWRLVIYGAVVILNVLYFPDGISRLLNRIANLIWPPKSIEVQDTSSRVGQQPKPTVEKPK